MRAMFVITLLPLWLTGCVSAPQYGNFVKDAAKPSALAVAAAQQLAQFYPPATTRWLVQQPSDDAFGTALLAALRARGYALEQTATPVAPVAAGVTSLNYLLDQAGESNLYRLSLQIGVQSMTRPYQVVGGEFVPVGYWVRKE
ncbi:MAG: hypothetical protein ACRCYV_10030 [Aeromonas sp.]